MKNTGLIVATVVLAGLLGLLYWSNRHKPADSTAVSTTPAEASPKILTLNEADLTRVEIKKKGGEPVVIERSGSGSWQITKPQSTPADQPSVSAFLGSLSTLTSDRVVEEKAANLTTYGLATPALEVTITDKNNATHKLLLGDDTPTSNATYAKLDGDARVFTIASFTKTGIDKGLDDLRNKKLLTVDADKLSRLQLVLKQQEIEFGRDKDQWQILKPKPQRADASKVDELVRQLTSASMEIDSLADSAKFPAVFAAGSPVAIARLTTDKGIQQLEIRKEKDKEDYYAKSSVVDGVYKVSSGLGEAMNKKADDFRERKLFSFGFGEPTKIEIQDSGKTYTLTKGGDDWWSSDGKKYDKSSAQALIDNLRDLQATDFADSGFTAVAVEVTVTPGEGKPAERVSLSKGSKNPVAKREGDATLYVLDAKALEDLQKAVSELKLQ